MGQSILQSPFSYDLLTSRTNIGGDADACKMHICPLVVYCVIFHHICVLSTIRIMFYIYFRDFPKDPHYFGFNSVKHKNHVLVFLLFRSYVTRKRARSNITLHIF
jgi:hypothetical protein